MSAVLSAIKDRGPGGNPWEKELTAIQPTYLSAVMKLASGMLPEVLQDKNGKSSQPFVMHIGRSTNERWLVLFVGQDYQIL